jgi:hypothetical protein
MYTISKSNMCEFYGEAQSISHLSRDAKTIMRLNVLRTKDEVLKLDCQDS